MSQKHLLVGLCAVAAIASFAFLSPESGSEAPVSEPPEDSALVTIQMPLIEGEAALGQPIFENNCATCHGIDGVGVDGAGPPLIHVIYETSHHGDDSFYRAVSMGVRGHHWPFGNMPPVEGVSRDDVELIVTYIREIQRANGIY